MPGIDEEDATEVTGLLGNTRRRMNFGRLTIIKLIELVLALIIVWFHYKTYAANDFNQLFIATATYAGYVIIVLGTFLGLVTGNPVNRTMDMFFCVVGAVLYIMAGSMSVDYWRGFRYSSSKETMGVSMGALAIIEGGLFILDAFFVFRAQ